MNTDVKILILGVVCIIFISSVGVAYNYNEKQWSNPIVANGTWTTQPFVDKPECIRSEWNDNFGKYRNDILSKQEMINYVRSCR